MLRELGSLCRAVFRAVRGPVRHRPACAPFSRSVGEREEWSEMVEGASVSRVDRADEAA